jgi:hypothetical protein
MKHSTFILVTAAAAWFSSPVTASASCYILEDQSGSCTYYETEGDYGLVVHKELTKDGTIITKFVSGVTRKEYPNGIVKFFQGKPVTSLSGAPSGNLSTQRVITPSGSLGR